MMKMHKYFLGKTVSSSRGFSLLEVLLGITVFMIGMLGVTALNISSLKSSTFAGNMSEAVIIAGDKIEELMALPFDDVALNDKTPPADGTNQDPTNVGIDTVGGGNFGLDNTGAAADGSDTGIGKNNMYDVYWNVAVAEPLNEKTKTVNVIVEWFIKDNPRRMNMSTIILDHD